jgi:hypothetical protein
MAKYKIITEASETRHRGVLYNWEKLPRMKDCQEKLEQAYNAGLTSFVEKIEDKPKSKPKKSKKDEEKL